MSSMELEIELKMEHAPYASETSKHRHVVMPYCLGFGIDIGFGGDPVTPAAVRVDLPEPYAYTGEFPVQLGGDCRDLRWFCDNQLDYVYSSHVLEDFDERETVDLMREWTRVLRLGGHLVLLLPDQQRYLRHCLATGQYINEHHSIDHFSLDYVVNAARKAGSLELCAQEEAVGDYSFVAVFRKTEATSSNMNEIESMRHRMMKALQERDVLKYELMETKKRLEQMECSLLYAEKRIKRITSHPLFHIGRRLYVQMHKLKEGMPKNP